MSKANESMEYFKQTGINGYESLRALGELNLRTWQKLAEQQMAAFGYLIDSGIKQVELAGGGRELTELVSGQLAIGRELNERLGNRGKQVGEIVREAGEAYRDWFEQGIANATGGAGKADA